MQCFGIPVHCAVAFTPQDRLGLYLTSIVWMISTIQSCGKCLLVFLEKYVICYIFQLIVERMEQINKKGWLGGLGWIKNWRTAYPNKGINADWGIWKYVNNNDGLPNYYKNLRIPLIAQSNNKYILTKNLLWVTICCSSLEVELQICSYKLTSPRFPLCDCILDTCMLNTVY